MKLTKNQKNILSTLVSSTLITKGKNKGKVKDSVEIECFDMRSAKKLINAGLIKPSCPFHGKSGWVATPAAFELI